MRKQLIILFSLLFLTTTFASGYDYHSPHTANPLHFKMSMIDSNASGTYGLIGHDINLDGYTDLVSFAYSGTTAGTPEGEIYWYEFNKKDRSWAKHLIAKKKHVVHGSFMDVDNDGLEDLVFMSDFEVPIKDPSKEGDIWWAKRPKNLNVPEWQTYWIGRSPGAHRIVSLTLDKSGTKGIIVIPLFGPGELPIYGPASISLYVPSNHPTLPWKKTIFSTQSFYAMHDAIVVPNDNNTQSLLVAAKEGLLHFTFTQDKQDEWQLQTKILHPSPENSPLDRNARDKGFQSLDLKQSPGWNLSGITVLSHFDGNHPYLAAIDYTKDSSYLLNEPWHGDTVSLYLPKNGADFFSVDGFERKVLEKRTPGGHAVQVADFNGDGCPDVVSGFRVYPTGLILYLCKKTITKNKVEYHFEKQIISERSANAIVIGNWNPNGLPDMATVGYGNEGDGYIVMWSNQSR